MWIRCIIKFVRRLVLIAVAICNCLLACACNSIWYYVLCLRYQMVLESCIIPLVKLLKVLLFWYFLLPYLQCSCCVGLLDWFSVWIVDTLEYLGYFVCIYQSSWVLAYNLDIKIPDQPGVSGNWHNLICSSVITN